ncbi:MAG TPA: ChbG/HpnK family deacetylase [Pseudorhodoplanes sp.]|jgi:predicted glycoside hydrolase/deacetylase ChbG (UPF0249 family)|nr:ChbG/HpnK family deacetylase [Pseudorhodoplanes sp.]
MTLRRIFLVADDYGISPAVSAAIRDLVIRGRLNATSVMVGTPSFDRSEATSLSMLNSDRKRVSIGLHITLTAPFRPMSAHYRPLHDGRFLPLEETGGRAVLRRLDPASLAREVDAQFRAFAEAFGRPPDFVDGHQHMHLFPQIRDAVLAATRRHAPHAWVRQCGRVCALRKRLADPKGLVLDILSRGLRKRAGALGLSTNPGFAGTYGFRPGDDFAALFPAFLDNLAADSVVMCHPGKVDAELRALDWVTTPREREYDYFVSDEFPKQLRTHGLTLG